MFERAKHFLLKEFRASGRKDPEDYSIDTSSEIKNEGELQATEPSPVEPHSEAYTPGSKKRRWEKRADKKRSRREEKIKNEDGSVNEASSPNFKPEDPFSETSGQAEPESRTVPQEADRVIEEEVESQVSAAMPELAPLVKDEKNFSRQKLVRKISSFAKNKLIKEALVGFVAGTGGAMAYKYIVGQAVRAGVKHAFDWGTVGAGAAVGGVVGGTWEGGKALYKEKKRTKAVQAELEGKHGVERVKALCKLKNKEDIENLQGTDKELWEKLQSNKVDKWKIVKATSRGAIIGALGGALGGAIVEYLGGGTTVQASNTETPPGAALTGNAGTLEAGAASTASATTINREMHENTWNTVKEYLKEQGVKNPSNDLVNQATRRITDINNIDITGDHADKAAGVLHHHIEGGVRDITMKEGFSLKGFEQLNDLVKSAGGKIATEAGRFQMPAGLPEAGLTQKAVQETVMETTWLTKKNAQIAGIVLELGAIGVLTPALIKQIKLFRKSKEQQSVNTSAARGSKWRTSTNFQKETGRPLPELVQPEPTVESGPKTPPTYAEAVRLFVGTKNVSEYLLRRQGLKDSDIDSFLIKMQEDGIISEPDINGRRIVIVDRQGAEEILVGKTQPASIIAHPTEIKSKERRASTSAPAKAEIQNLNIERDEYSFEQLKDVVKSLLGDKATINKLDLNPTPAGLNLNAELDGGWKAGKIIIAGKIVNRGNSIAIEGLDIQARGYVQSKIEAKLAGFSSTIEAYFKQRSPDKKIKGIKITEHGLVVEFENPEPQVKVNQPVPATVEPQDRFVATAEDSGDLLDSGDLDEGASQAQARAVDKKEKRPWQVRLEVEAQNKGANINKWVVLMRERGGPLWDSVGNGLEENDVNFVKALLRGVSNFSNPNNADEERIVNTFNYLANRDYTPALAKLIGELKAISESMDLISRSIRVVPNSKTKKLRS